MKTSVSAFCLYLMTPSSKRGNLGSNALWNPDDEESRTSPDSEIGVTVESVTPIQGGILIHIIVIEDAISNNYKPAFECSYGIKTRGFKKLGRFL